MKIFLRNIDLMLIFGLASLLAGAELRNMTPTSRPEASVNLMTNEGASLVQAQWRYSDTKIVEAAFTGPGADGQPTGRPVKTYDYSPHAGGADFDDSQWEQISPTSLKNDVPQGGYASTGTGHASPFPKRWASFPHWDLRSYLRRQWTTTPRSGWMAN